MTTCNYDEHELSWANRNCFDMLRHEATVLAEMVIWNYFMMVEDGYGDTN